MSLPTHLAAGCLCFTLLIEGCSSIIYGGRQEVIFDSKPPGASVKIGTELRFTTPQTVSLPRSKAQIAIFEKEGYETQQIEITRAFQALPVILGNILWLPIGLVFDMVTGSAWKLEPEYISIELQKVRKTKGQ